MAERVRATVERELGPESALRVQHAVVRALAARAALHPKDVRYLHPGRTVLILFDDAAVRDEAVLAAGALVETYHPALAVPPVGAARAGREGGNDAARLLDAGRRMEDLLARIPVPSAGQDEDALREALVVADAAARTVALVERLDHARHLHLYPRAEWDALHAHVRAVYLPVAEWAGGRIAARYRRWADAFERRLARERGPGRRSG